MPVSKKKPAVSKKSQAKKPIPEGVSTSLKKAKDSVSPTAVTGAQLDQHHRHRIERRHTERFGRLVEVPIHGTIISLLGMPDSKMIPTTEERAAIARRIAEYSDVLTKYVPQAAVKKLMDAAASGPTVAKAPREEPVATSKTKQSTEQSERKTELKDGVPLKKVCAEADIDPKLARRVLRAKGKKPGGRWEWTKEDAPGIVALLKQAKIDEEKKKGAAK